jgi:hypothetical protein
VGVTCVHHRRRRSKITATTAKRIEGLTHLVSITATRLIGESMTSRQSSLPRISTELGPTGVAQLVRDHVGLGIAADQKHDRFCGELRNCGHCP